MEAAAYQCIDETITALKQDMENITSANAVNIFTTSALLTIQTKIRSHQVRTPNTPYLVPMNYFHLHAGARELFKKTKPYIEGSDVQAWSEWRPDLRFHSSLNNTNTTSNSTPFMFPYDPLIDLWSALPASSAPPALVPIYASAFSYLALLKSCIVNQEPRHWVQRRFSIITSEVPIEFLQILEQKDGLAFAIMARVFALLRFVDESWWLRGTAEYDVVGLSGMVGEEWRWAMEWPLQVVRGVREEHQLR